MAARRNASMRREARGESNGTGGEVRDRALDASGRVR